MMLTQFIENDLVSYHQSFNDWQSAVRVSCHRLLQHGYIDETYVSDIIECIKKHGPYIVIVPGIAMPHATEGGAGVHKTGIAFMKVEEPVVFMDGTQRKEAQLFFTLAAKDHEKHLENITRLMELLLNDEIVEAIKATTSIEMLKSVAQKYDL